MFRKMLYITLLFAMLGLNNAMAQGSFFYIGKRLGKSLVNTAWNGVGRDCGRLDSVFDIMARSRSRVVRRMKKAYHNNGIESATEFAEGYVNGFISAFDPISERCDKECSTLGTEIGEETAYVFCDLSILIGRTAVFAGMSNIQNTFCGEPYKVGCESKFIGTASKECSSYARGGEYDNFYRSDKNGCCAYDASNR